MNSEFFQLLCLYIPWQRAKRDGCIRGPLVITFPIFTLFRVPAFQSCLIEISICSLNIALHLISAFFTWIWKPETGQCRLTLRWYNLIDSSFNTTSSRKHGADPENSERGGRDACQLFWEFLENNTKSHIKGVGEGGYTRPTAKSAHGKYWNQDDVRLDVDVC